MEDDAKPFKLKLPHMSNKMTRVIAKDLRGLVYTNLHELYQQYKSTETNGASSNAKRAIRRKLNTQLFGVYGLREGRTHLNQLCDELRQCINANPWKSVLPPDRISTIADALRYIFSDFNHKDYDAIMEEYEALRAAGQLQQVNYYSLGFPRIISQPSNKPNKNNKQQNKFNKPGKHFNRQN